MIDRKVNGYIFNHNKTKFLEIFIFSNLSHPIKDIKNLAETNNLQLSIKQNNALNLTRIYIYYKDYEVVKSLYKELNENLKLKNISYYETIKTVRTLLKYGFYNEK